MKGVRLALLILLCYWIVFAFKFCKEDVKLSVARKLCDIEGRELASIQTEKAGFIVRYTCGKRKPAPESTEKP